MGCSSSSEHSPTQNNSRPPSNVVSTKPNPLSNLTPEQIANLSEDEIIALELGGKKFMKKLKEVDTSRDYSIIVDASGSMSGSRWRDAEAAVEFLAPEACKCDPDGISLYFFSNSFAKYDNVQTSQRVMELFHDKKNQFFGGTELSGVLEDAVKPDTPSESGKHRRPETILVITDGEPNSKSAVENVIINATKEMTSDDELSITFIQVGNDSGAAKWLEQLDEGLQARGAKFDVVDIITYNSLKNTNFVEIIKKSIQD